MTLSPRAQAGTVKPVVMVAGVGPGIGTSIARAFGAEGFAVALLARDSARLVTGTGVRVGTVTVYGPVERGTAFDPDDIAAALVRLHRGTNEGVEIHFTHRPPASRRPERSTGSVAPT